MRRRSFNPKGFHVNQIPMYLVLLPLALFMSLPIVFIVNHAFKPIEEVGNILVGAYLSAISSMTNMLITPSVPALSVDMVMAMMNVPAVVYGEIGESVLRMETEFHNDLSSVTGRYFLVPTMDSYGRLMKALGL